MINRKYKTNTDNGGIANILAVGKSVYSDINIHVDLVNAEGYITDSRMHVVDFSYVEKIESDDRYQRIY